MTLTLDQASNAVFYFSGQTAAVAVTIPLGSYPPRAFWFVFNAGSYPVTMTPPAGTTVVVPPGCCQMIWTDGGNLFPANAAMGATGVLQATGLSLTGSVPQSTVLAGPASGSAAPTQRQLGVADISGAAPLASPTFTGTTTTGTLAVNGAFTVTGAQLASTVLAGPTATWGAPTWRQLVVADIFGAAPLAAGHSQTNVAAPVAPALTTAYKMQGLAGTLTPSRSGVCSS